uniref:Uncharacterized protein n=1 Tax=viral metagenome TaxID=1070528 RepID=A0A6C0CLU9_9ZZZZ
MEKQIKAMGKYLYDRIRVVNDSKIFAGLVILTLNITSKMITLPMSKTVEGVIKHSLSQYVLVFAISWMGTRDVFVAGLVTLIFAILMELLFNENSMFCILPEGFVSNTMSKLQQDEELTKEELDSAMSTIEKAKTLLQQEKGKLQ